MVSGRNNCVLETVCCYIYAVGTRIKVPQSKQLVIFGVFFCVVIFK